MREQEPNQSVNACAQVKQITADITPILRTFSQGILQDPSAASVLNQLTSSPEVSAAVSQIQSLADLLSPNIQGLLVMALRLMSAHFPAQFAVGLHPHDPVMS